MSEAFTDYADGKGRVGKMAEFGELSSQDGVCGRAFIVDNRPYNPRQSNSLEAALRILVTGGAGFIGSNLAKRLVREGHDVTVADDFQSAHWTNLIDFKGDVVTADVADVVNAIQSFDPFEVIFHQASITDTTVHDQRRMMHNNVEGFRVILDLAAKWKSRVVWASSASIYGRRQPPNSENQPPDPLNVYACSKLLMERLAERYRSRLAQPIVALRYFNVYGPGEDHKGKFASMIHQLAKQMRGGKRPRIFTPGDQKRDFVYVEDVVQANLKALVTTNSGVCNVGCGGSYSFNEVVTELNRVLGTDLPPEYFDNPYSFTQDWTEANVGESRKGLGYEPKFDLRRGVEAYAESGKLGVSI
jgi:ADP-L-glycero-D-manno-heptose 6-epimerase